MAKKFVRGITDVKTINNQDFDTNNVNDLLSDGQYNYIHRKKGETEEYHNLTDNIKTISSDNTELLSVTNNNKTTNTATLHPKHDAQKEQVLESTRDTITINHGTNGTAEKTTVDTNPQKVLEHENLDTTYGISKATSGNVTTLGLEYTKVEDGFDLNNLENGRVRAGKFINSPQANKWFFVSSFTEHSFAIQEAVTLIDDKNTTYRRTKQGGTWSEWREQVGDKSVIDGLLAQKQDKLTAGTGITIQGNTISATGGGAPVEGASVSFHQFGTQGTGLYAVKYTITSGSDVMTQFTFECQPGTNEFVITGALKEELRPYIAPYGMVNKHLSSGAITITATASVDGIVMKLVNSNYAAENVVQQETFTFYEKIGDVPGV